MSVHSLILVKDWGTIGTKIVENYHFLGQLEKNKNLFIIFLQKLTSQICTRLLEECVEKI